MAQQTINILITYWVITTIIGVCWMIKNPRPSDNKEYFNLIIIQQDEILLDKMINPNNWERLQIVTTSKHKNK